MILRVLQTRHFAGQGKQTGMALMAMVVVVVIFCAVLLASRLVQQARDEGKSAGDQQQQARLAERALNSFAALYGRLPCPAVQKNGLEDCAGPAKGWLPVKTLEQSGLFVSKSQQYHDDVRYMVYRGSGSVSRDPDLAEPTPSMVGTIGSKTPDAFVPAVVNGDPVGGYPVVPSSLDLCGKLRGLLPNPDASRRWDTGDPAVDGLGRPDRAHLPSSGSTAGPGVVNVAYAIAVASTGKARPQPDRNSALSLLVMESPRRSADAAYTDIVRSMDPRVLYEALACGTAIASLDNLAVAQSWVAEAVGVKEGNVAMGPQIMDMGIPIAVGDGAFVLSEVTDIANGIYNEIDNATKAGAAVYNIPLFLNYLWGDSEAAMGLVWSSIDLARNAASAAVDSLFVFRYVDVANKAAELPVWTGGRDILKQADEIGLVNETAGK